MIPARIHVQFTSLKPERHLIRAMVNGRAWALSTNGHAMVGVESDDTSLPLDESIAKAFGEYCASEPKHTHKTTLTKLRALFGEARPATFGECECKTEGVGGVCLDCGSHEIGCGGDGEFYDPPPMREAFVLGMPLDANLAACALAALPDGVSEGAEMWRDNAALLQIRSKRWRVLVMGMAAERVQADAPVLLPPLDHRKAT